MALVVRLNGNNYVSEQRAKAFEKALEGADCVLQAATQADKAHPATDGLAAVTQAAPGWEQAAPPVAAPSQSTAMPQEIARLLDSLERGLTHSHNHQTETLHVHRSYLEYQAEYTKLYAQLVQQQGALFANGNGSTQQRETALAVLATLARHTEQLHAAQLETLGIHDAFLKQQASYAESFVQLLQAQFGRLIGGNGRGNGNGHYAPGLNRPTLARETYDLQAVVMPAQVSEPPAPALISEVVQAAPVQAAVLGTAVDVDAVAPDRLTESLLRIVSEKTGYPPDMLSLDMDMEADLGIDSIKRVEILGALQDAHPNLPEVAPQMLSELRTLGSIVSYIQGSAIAPAGTPDTGEAHVAEMGAPQSDLAGVLLGIISEKTGYPADMLELSMDMEADLGIDSIKRVEILGALQERIPGLPAIDTQALSELRTLAQIVAYVAAHEDGSKKA